MICAECQREIPEGASFCAFCGLSMEPAAGSRQAPSRKQTIWSIVAGIFLCLLIPQLPDIPAFIFGLATISGTVLFIHRCEPRILRSFLGELGLAVIGMGLAVYASGWFVADDFYSSVMIVLNSFWDPAYREFWHDPELLEEATFRFSLSTKSDLGQEILQVVGTTFVVLGALIFSLNILLSWVKRTG